MGSLVLPFIDLSVYATLMWIVCCCRMKAINESNEKPIEEGRGEEHYGTG